MKIAFSQRGKKRVAILTRAGNFMNLGNFDQSVRIKHKRYFDVKLRYAILASIRMASTFSSASRQVIENISFDAYLRSAPPYLINRQLNGHVFWKDY